MKKLGKKQSERREIILDKLAKVYKDVKPALVYSSNYELLISVILSAQCTDVRVNIVTDELFKKYNSPEKMLLLSQEELLKKIKSCGLGPSKSKNILAASQMLVDEYNSVVPNSIVELQKLPGVGKKTANVVASVAFDIPAIAVDTHVFRVANRIGLANADNVKKTEDQLMEIIPKELWSKAHHWLIWHGRNLCTARKPKCDECFLSTECTFVSGEKAFFTNIKKNKEAEK